MYYSLTYNYIYIYIFKKHKQYQYQELIARLHDHTPPSLVPASNRMVIGHFVESVIQLAHKILAAIVVLSNAGLE